MPGRDDTIARPAWRDGTKPFQMSPVESERTEAFKRRHEHKSKKDRTRTFTYSFTQGGIGTMVVVTCNACESSKDVTEYEGW